MVTKILVGAAALIAVLGVNGCSATVDPASRAAYLDIMCAHEEAAHAFFEVQATYDMAQIRRAAGPLSEAELTAANALVGVDWDPSIVGHIPAISASLRATSELWADIALRGTSSVAPSVEVVEAGGAAREAVEAALQIDFPLACSER
jgi:hypothetical protein